ncbi:MAG: PEP-CTERM sorting domain-containing protein [Planctomycetota bacterium]
MIRIVILTLAISLCFANSDLRADVVIEIADQTVTQGTVGAEIDVLIRSDAGDDPIAIGADFEILNAAFADPPGVFDQPGFYNEGNYNSVSAIQADANNTSIVAMSLDIDNPLAISASNVLLARLFVDSQGLAPGTYDINVSNAFVLNSDGSTPATTGVGGTLTIIAAIPEPSSSAVVGAAIGLLVMRRRRR